MPNLVVHIYVCLYTAGMYVYVHPVCVHSPFLHPDCTSSQVGAQPLTLHPEARAKKS